MPREWSLPPVHLLTVSGFTLWVGAAFQGAPRVVKMRGGGAVPFWLMPAGAFLEAVSDGMLTTGELAAIDGLLTGTATHFDERIHPHENPPEMGGGGGHTNPKLEGSRHAGRWEEYVRLDGGRIVPMG